MAFSTAGSGPLRAEINITPMIDVLLVLIIVFMVVVSMSDEKGLQAQIPQPPTKENSAPPPVRTIVIQVVGGQKLRLILLLDQKVFRNDFRLSFLFMRESLIKVD